MVVKRLVREGFTYDRLQRVFEECCSFMDFFQFLKDKGVERKVAKFIALRFGGMGLQNQGALLKPAIEKPNSVITDSLGSSVIARNGCSPPSEIPPVALKKSVTFKEPVEDVLPARLENPPADPPDWTGQDSEDWDAEIADFGGECSEFTLTFGKVIPISLMVEDLCSPALKTEQSKSSRTNRGRKKTHVVDRQSNSDESSLLSSKVTCKGNVLEKERKCRLSSAGNAEESSGSAESKPDPSVDAHETSLKETALPTKGHDVNGALEQAQCSPQDDKVSDQKTGEEEIPQQCVWFTDEASSDVVASMEILEFVTVFIGDVAVRVPVNERPCDSVSQKQTPCFDHEQEHEDHDEGHDVVTEEERSVEANDFNTETNFLSASNQGEIPVSTSIMALETANALETEAAIETSPEESSSAFLGAMGNGLDERSVESEQAQNGDSELRLSETVAASTETGGTCIVDQFAYPEALDERNATRTMSPNAAHDAHFSSDDQTGDPNAGETSEEDLSKTDLSHFPQQQQRREVQGFSFLETDADEEVGPEPGPLDNPRRDCRLREVNGITGGHEVDHGDTAVIPPPWEKSHQGIAEGNEHMAEHELRRVRDASNFDRILNQLYSSPGNPYRRSSHYHYPSTSLPPFSFVPRMLPMQPMFMQPCLYPPAYGSANFRAGQTHVPFFAPPTIQRAMFPSSSGLYPQSGGIEAATAEQERTSHQYYADVESESSCSSVSTDREDETRIETVRDREELGATVSDISASLANGSVRSENESTQSAGSCSSCFPDATVLHMGGVGGSPKPQRIKRPRIRKTCNGNTIQNGTDGHKTVSQYSKADVALATQHNRGQGRNGHVYIAPKQYTVSSSRGNDEESKSFKEDFAQSNAIINALETARTGCDEVAKDKYKGGRTLLMRDKEDTTTVSGEAAERETSVARKQPLPPRDCTTFQEHSKKSRSNKGHKRRPRQDVLEKSKPKLTT